MMTPPSDPHDPPRHLHWGVQALWRQLEPLLPGLSVEVVARTASTNSELLERARLAPAPRASDFGELAPSGRIGRRQADAKPCLLVAEQQYDGRGRLGRTWHSAPGASLTFSLALPLAPLDWSGLSLAVGVALAEALQPKAAPGLPRLMVKWPNDLWLVDDGDDDDPSVPLAGRKLGGVLIETLAARRDRLAVIGVGLNVQPLPDVLDSDLDPEVACLQEIDPGATAPSVLAKVALPLLEALRAFEQHGFAAFSRGFAARDLLHGRRVATTQPGVPSGMACGVDAHGALCVETPDGQRHAVSSGEVSVRLHTGTGNSGFGALSMR